MNELRPEHIKVEEQFISILLTNKDAIKKWVSGNISTKHFDTVHEYILKAIAWANGESVALTRQSFRGYIEGIVDTPAAVAAQMTIFNRIFIQGTKPDDYPMLLEKIRKGYIHRKSAEIVSDYNRERQSLGVEEANERMAKKMMNLSVAFEDSHNVYMDLGAERDKFMKELHERRKNPAKRLICNIPEIDDTMAVGFKVGTLTIFTAAPGTFKTTMMMNIALNIFKNSGENVLYIPLEGGADMFMQKLVSRETMIPSTKIEHAHLLTDEEVKRVADEFDKWNKLSNKFKVAKPGDRAKCSTLRHEIESRLGYFKPRIVVVDYLDNVVADTKQQRDDLDSKEKMEELIRMGDNFGFSIITAAKLSREAIKRLRDTKEGKQDLDTTDVHGGQEFGANATNLYGQMRNANQPGSILDLFCMKSRFGSPIFKNGKSKAPLNIKPEIGLIESPMSMSEGWSSDKGKEAISILNTQPPPVVDNLPLQIDEDAPF